MNCVETTAPTSRPVTVTAAATHCRICEGEESAYLQSLIDVATAHAQDSMECSLMPRTLTATFHKVDKIFLPKGPLISITSITDDDGKTITDYDIEHHGHMDELVINESFTHPLTVVYQAGHESAAAIPATMKHAILCHVGTLYQNRESISQKNLVPVPHSLEAFYRMNRRGMGIG